MRTYRILRQEVWSTGKVANARTLDEKFATKATAIRACDKLQSAANQSGNPLGNVYSVVEHRVIYVAQATQHSPHLGTARLHA